jgi:hypothetical protein
MTVVLSVHDSVWMYHDLGFDTLPLWPGTKNPCRKTWQFQSPDQMWRSMPDNANIGVRGGGPVGLAVLDCDEKNQPGTFNNAISWLAGIGYLPGDYPTVKTASLSGRHIYLSLRDKLAGDMHNLTKDFGSGELRFGSGSFVVAPPSQVEKNTYLLLSGDYRQLPQIEVVDLLDVLGFIPALADSNQVTPHISRTAWKLLWGKHANKYLSRSEAEQALIASLIATGHDFNQILELFRNYPCAGKFHELAQKSDKRAAAWLQRSFMNAVQWLAQQENNDATVIEKVIAWAQSIPWTGRTGLFDKAVFLAHCEIVRRAYKLQYSASARQLAELAGVTALGASRASHRLVVNGYLEMVMSGVADRANIYRLGAKVLHSLSTNCEEV